MVGVGNVALDVARVLIKPAEELADTDMADEVLDSLAHKEITDVHMLGRRGPAYTAFTTKELRSSVSCPSVDMMVDPADLELDESSLAPSWGGTRSPPATSRCCGSGPTAPGGRRRDGSTCTSGPDRSDHRRGTGSRRSRSSGP